MLKIGEKTFMNLQEAVAWLLDNNSIPFQCTANYAANTEIGLGTIVNPTPAKVKIGSLIFFADSKVSTVIGITETGFICSDKFNNLVDDIAYVTGVAIDSSQHLITTLSDGQTIDAGLIKQISGLSIDSSQHLIATFNDGTTTDLGAIFQGNVNINGNLTANSIIENMNGYSFNKSVGGVTREFLYVGACKNGNKLTLVVALKVTRPSSFTVGNFAIGSFLLPLSVMNKLIPIAGTALCYGQVGAFDSQYSDPIQLNYSWTKTGGYVIPNIVNHANQLVVDTPYYIRMEQTFLLSENMAS